MRVNRDKHPFISKGEFTTFIQDLTELELKNLQEVLEEETNCLDEYMDKAAKRVSDVEDKLKVLRDSMRKKIRKILEQTEEEELEELIKNAKKNEK